MYSNAWFDTFAAQVPESTTAGDVVAIQGLAPPKEYPRLIDVGCGSGRMTGRLVECGYRVTAIDTSVVALQAARERAPDARYVALDQRHAGDLRWTFDVAIVLWNSFGFGSREADLETLRGLGRVVRPGGRALLDLYHPDWLAANEQSGVVDERGATIDRWVSDGRCFHEMRYVDGSVDDIQFNVYRPDQIEGVLRRAGFRTDAYLVWWKPEARPGATFARYQVVSTRLGPSG
jgi:SAM-dependent methyltransferase